MSDRWVPTPLDFCSSPSSSLPILYMRQVHLSKRNRREESSKESLNQYLDSTAINRISQRLTQKMSRGSCSLSGGNKAWWLVISTSRVIPSFFTPGTYRCFRQMKPLFLFCLLKAWRAWWAPNPDCYSADLVKMPEGHHVKLWSYKSVFLPAEQ